MDIDRHTAEWSAPAWPSDFPNPVLAYGSSAYSVSVYFTLYIIIFTYVGHGNKGNRTVPISSDFCLVHDSNEILPGLASVGGLRSYLLASIPPVRSYLLASVGYLVRSQRDPSTWHLLVV